MGHAKALFSPVNLDNLNGFAHIPRLIFKCILRLFSDSFWWFFIAISDFYVDWQAMAMTGGGFCRRCCNCNLQQASSNIASATATETEFAALAFLRWMAAETWGVAWLLMAKIVKCTNKVVNYCLTPPPWKKRHCCTYTCSVAPKTRHKEVIFIWKTSKKHKK